MKNREATIKEIKYWYKFRPSIKMWITKHLDKSVKSRRFYHIEETWYDGYPFKSGMFIFKNFGKFQLMVDIMWWKIKI